MNLSNLPFIFECKDTSEKIDFYELYGFYIKPIARLNITIQLPPAKNPGQVVSNAEIIEKIKKQSLPEEFVYLRVIKSTFEFIRCEGEIENKSSLKSLLSKLDGFNIKMNTFTDVLKVRAAESKIVYPTRHDWDSFFKDTLNPLNELKPGERPDTIYLADMPCKWFSDSSDLTQVDKPSINIITQIFSIFGEIRLIDIVNLPSGSLKKQSLSAVDLVSSGSLNLSTFEAFIQYKDYISFVKAMDTFRGMKLLYMDENKNAYTANIRVDFDKTCRLSDKEIKKREIDKLKNIEIEKIKTAQFEKEKEKEAKQKEIANFRLLLEESMNDYDAKNPTNPDDLKNEEEKSKEQRRREREEIRRQKRFAKKQQEEEKKLEMKIALEERKILIAQRKLESMRLLEELFNRVKVIFFQEEQEKRLKELKENEHKRKLEEANQESIKKMKHELEEQELKEKILKNLKNQSEESTEPVKAEEEEEFELRKDPIPKTNEQTDALKSPEYSSQVAMPRSVLLSNTQLTQAQKPQLYDEEDNLNMKESSQNDEVIENKIESIKNEESKNSSDSERPTSNFDMFDTNEHVENKIEKDETNSNDNSCIESENKQSVSSISNQESEQNFDEGEIKSEQQQDEEKEEENQFKKNLNENSNEIV